MIRPTKNREFVINLDGPDGNAFVLMAYAKRLMMDGDYTNLVRTFDKYFGEFVILETTNEELLDA